MSSGLLGLSPMPSRLPPHAAMTQAGPLPSSRLSCLPSPVLRAPRTPSRLRVFSAMGLMDTAFALAGCRVGSPVFRIPLSKRAAASKPRGGPASLPVSRGAVCCLRRDLSGSALPITFRLIICRGYGVHLVAARFVAPPSGLSTLRLDGRISPSTRSLLPGAPALTRTGLSPARVIQLSRRTTRSLYAYSSTGTGRRGLRWCLGLVSSSRKRGSFCVGFPLSRE